MSHKKRILMEELLAHMSSATGSLKRVLQEWVGAVRDWLRKKGYADLAEYGATDLAHVLKQAREASRSAVSNKAAPMFSLRAKSETPAPKTAKISDLAAELKAAFDYARNPPKDASRTEMQKRLERAELIERKAKEAFAKADPESDKAGRLDELATDARDAQKALKDTLARDKAEREAGGHPDDLLHDKDAGGSAEDGATLTRPDAHTGSVLESIAAAKKQPLYKALFKAIGDLSKGGKAGPKTQAKYQKLADALAKAFGVPRLRVSIAERGTPLRGGETLSHGAYSRGEHVVFLSNDLKAHERMSVFLHEFAHHMEMTLVAHLPENHPLRVELAAAYDAWLAERSTGETRNAARASRAPFFRSLNTLRALKDGIDASPTLAESGARSRLYLLDAHEFFADMTARALEQHEGVQGVVGQFFAKIAHAMKLGKYDIVIVAEAADETAATAFILSIGSLGNTRTQTLRAFSSDEMAAILAKMP